MCRMWEGQIFVVPVHYVFMLLQVLYLKMPRLWSRVIFFKFSPGVIILPFFKTLMQVGSVVLRFSPRIEVLIFQILLLLSLIICILANSSLISVCSFFLSVYLGLLIWIFWTFFVSYGLNPVVYIRGGWICWKKPEVLLKMTQKMSLRLRMKIAWRWIWF